MLLFKLDLARMFKKLIQTHHEIIETVILWWFFPPFLSTIQKRRKKNPIFFFYFSKRKIPVVWSQKLEPKENTVKQRFITRPWEWTKHSPPWNSSCGRQQEKQKTQIPHMVSAREKIHKKPTVQPKKTKKPKWKNPKLFICINVLHLLCDLYFF